MRMSWSSLCRLLSLLPDTELQSQKKSPLDQKTGKRSIVREAPTSAVPPRSQVAGNAFWVLTRLEKKATPFRNEAETTLCYG